MLPNSWWQVAPPGRSLWPLLQVAMTATQLSQRITRNRGAK